MGSLQELPLFPLKTVLFPGMNQPLHIFEPRYRLMISECIENNRPFGAVLIKDGVEVGAQATPYEVGTSAYVTQIERAPDGRMNIQTVGYQRFKIHALQRHRPYLVGLVEDSPLSGEENPENDLLAAKLAAGQRVYLDLLKKASEHSVDLDAIPDRSMALAYLTAIILPLPNHEKQSLLVSESLTALLRVETVLIRRETMLLKHMIEHGQQEGDAELFSIN